MSCREEVHAYGLTCERLFSVAKDHPLTSEETNRIEYYCVKLLAEIAPYLAKDDLQTP